MYIIKIIGNYDFINLLNEELYCVEFKLLNKCTIEIWEELNIYNKSHKPLIGKK